jgi:myo-inositol-1(or 4)-monophosphatase
MLEIAIQAAREAGRIQKTYLGKISHINTKSGDSDLVTEVDKRCEERIIEIIRQHYPTHSILAEESGAHNTPSEYKWIIDPLDGTTNYAHAFPFFGVSIGLERRGELMLGVVYNPNLDELFTAQKGIGAFLNHKPIKVSQISSLAKSLLITGFPYNLKDNPHNCVGHFNNFLVSAQAVRRLGSASLDLCYLACGRFDGFWEVSLNPWDAAAGVLLIREAGGRVTDFLGNEYDIYKGPILASNGKIHEAMIELLKKGM